MDNSSYTALNKPLTPGQKNGVNICQEKLDNSWKSTTRILLGEELDDLSNYEEWLAKYTPSKGKRKSSLSGKPVTLNVDFYSKDANFISSDEIKDSAPLSINDIKDIDSVVDAITERWQYAGNKVLGNSKFVENSDLVIDSQYVVNSTNISNSSNVFSSFLVRSDSKHCFGSGFFGEAEFILRTFAGYNLKRVFESYYVIDSSDIYFSHHAVGCSELLFSFSQRSKRHCIGNLQLTKDKYSELKKKLLAEVVQGLKKYKSFPSIFEMVPDKKPAQLPELKIIATESKTDMTPIEKAFASTFRVIFKKEPKKIDDFEELLSRHSIKTKSITSMFGYKTNIPDYSEFAYSLIPKSRIVSLKEALELGKIHLNEEDITSLEKIVPKLDKIGFFTAEVFDGINNNIIDSTLLVYATNVYKTFDATHSEYVGIASQALNSKYIFGGNRVISSEFCINCYNSTYLTRCFEVDTSTKCSDALFCHNSEGLSDALFCFNLKGKRHVIGNTILPIDQYTKIRNSLIEQIADELLSTKTSKFDIFDIGSNNKKRSKLWHQQLTN